MREINPNNPPYGGCDCDCHIQGMVVMHCVACCYPPKAGATLIAEERVRHVTSEGWTAEHDDWHSHAELIQAAICYLDYIGPDDAPAGWPWDERWWKPTPNDRVRELVKAGALIAAEIDRLQRLG